jgi:hypothetical protein
MGLYELSMPLVKNNERGLEGIKRERERENVVDEEGAHTHPHTRMHSHAIRVQGGSRVSGGAG